MIRKHLSLLASLVLCNTLAIAQVQKPPAPLSTPQKQASFSFQAVSVSQVIQLIYSEVLQGSYVLDPEILKDERQVSFRFKEGQGDVRAFSLNFLESLGFTVQSKGGVAYIGKIKPEQKPELEKTSFVYRPKHRDVGSLSRLLAPLFTGQFALNRGVSVPEFVKSDKPVTEGSATSLIDQTSDVLVFHSTQKEIDRLTNLLAQIDQPQGEVVIRSVFYEVNEGRGSTNAMKAVISLLQGRLGVSVGTGASPTGELIKIATGKFDAVISALNNDNRFKQIASPTMRIRSGQPGRFSVGQDVPTLGSISNQNTGQTMQSVVYQQSGVILELSPTVRENIIDLKIKQQMSNFTPTANGVNNSPTLTKREIQSTVSLTDGEIAVLGSLNQSTDSNTSSGISFLPNWMRSKSSDASKSELLLLLQAQKL